MWDYRNMVMLVTSTRHVNHINYSIKLYSSMTRIHNQMQTSDAKVQTMRVEIMCTQV